MPETTFDAETGEVLTKMQESIIYVDPETLKLHAANHRKATPDISDLVESVRSLGVIQPILITKEGEIIAGRRRQLAAIEVGRPLVPALVVYGDALATALTSYAENHGRRELDAQEEAASIQGLLDLGAPEVAVASAAGTSIERVQSAKKVAKSKGVKAALKATARPLSFDEAAAIAEFDGTEWADEIVQTLKDFPDQLAHALSECREERTDEQNTIDFVAKLKADYPDASIFRDFAGFAEVEKLGGWSLRADYGVKDFEHVSCPGAVLHFRRGDTELRSATWGCSKPELHVKKSKASTSTALSLAEQKRKDKEAKERRETIAGNRAWKAATSVRREFIANLVKRAKPPTGTADFVLFDLLEHGRFFPGGSDLKTALPAITGRELKDRWSTPKIVETKGLTGDKLLMAALTATAVSIESYAEGNAWAAQGVLAERMKAWLAFLARSGYVAAPIEYVVLGDKTRASFMADAVKSLAPKKATTRRVPARKAAKR